MPSDQRKVAGSGPRQWHRLGKAVGRQLLQTPIERVLRVALYAERRKPKDHD